jgi:ribosome-associated protein
MAALSAEATARLAARAALDKNAEDLVILDLQGLSSVADFFVVASARSTTQADTIVEGVRLALKAAGPRPRHQEGSAESGWLLLDYIDVVVHVFVGATRHFYALERLWGDAPLLSVERGRASRD